MRVLVIKTSSLGDVIHTLPALTDAALALPDITFDWVVEEGFADIPAMHSHVDKVIPVAIRRWRGSLLKTLRAGEWNDFKAAVGGEHYSAVIDAQGLLKSAWLTRYARGPLFGYSNASAREPLASQFYHHKITVPRDQHAVERTRQLFAQSLGYDLPTKVGRSGIDTTLLPKPNVERPYLLFFHGTTWDTKHWPEFYWKELGKKVTESGYQVMLPWGNDIERQRAERISEVVGEDAIVMPRTGLREVAGWIAGAKGVVAVDTGLAHLSAAMDIPMVSLYGSTDPGLSGAYGKNQTHLYANYDCAPCMKRECNYTGLKVKNQLEIAQGEYVDPPCFSSIMPNAVFDALEQQIFGVQRDG
ncbi:lipopolysaccharide heptosyltransferase I [Gammaproteobacteria bacterium 45_16_T64]|nr:lipopolysaccharide heptosyltransferase I [Gammaproteobacteria bacterium 45_16_T64]